MDKSAKPVVCIIAGEVWKSNYVFNLNELPERCDIYSVGQFAFDRDDCIYVMEKDESAIKSLTEANKVVYLTIGFVNNDDWWSIFNPSDANEYKTQKFDPLVDFLNKYKLSGLFIYFPSLLDSDIQNVFQKISDFVTSIKEKIDGLKVGIVFYVTDQISNKTRFDFTLINEIMDHYVIDLSMLNECDDNSKIYGLSPISSETMVSIDQVTCVVTNSTVDQSKLFAKIQVSVLIPKDLVGEGVKTVTTYSIYCGDNDLAKSSKLCGNPSNLSYDQGAYVDKFYSGLYIECLDADDFECKCGCKNFPVTNIIIDGWEKCDFTACSKLDQN
ncbi:uncharacterized protein LOC113557850 [Rhopalosiphum maidis]|uniref:uncharacterized protein LOC113557850 n=1 Tax=Rhopalosiphum maidis TaxID=43146 RepID=UPI000EFF97FD|nr:uncharacterized protein LOC113557850 [Rhopalosiphum maidis]